MAAGPISPLQPNHKPPPRKPFLLMIIHTSYSSELKYNWSQEPHSGPIQALSHMRVPVQESVPETGGSLRTEGGAGGQSSPSQCTVHGMKGAGKVH